MLEKLLKNSLHFFKKQFLFIKLKKDIMTLSKLEQKKQKDTLPSNIYSRCSEIFLSQFTECLFDNNLQVLIKNGSASQNDLSKAWELIYNEYAELNESVVYRMVLSFEKEISRLDERYTQIKTACLVLSVKHSKYFIQLLKDFGYNYQFDYANKDSFEADLINVLKKAKSILIQKEQKEKAYQKYMSEQTGQKVTPSYFDDCLTAISQFMRIDYNPETIKLTKFVNILKKMNSYNEKLNEQNNKVNGKR